MVLCGCSRRSHSLCLGGCSLPLSSLSPSLYLSVVVPLLVVVMWGPGSGDGGGFICEGSVLGGEEKLHFGSLGL